MFASLQPSPKTTTRTLHLVRHTDAYLSSTAFFSGSMYKTIALTATFLSPEQRPWQHFPPPTSWNLSLPITSEGDEEKKKITTLSNVFNARRQTARRNEGIRRETSHHTCTRTHGPPQPPPPNPSSTRPHPLPPHPVPYPWVPSGHSGDDVCWAFSLPASSCPTKLHPGGATGKYKEYLKTQRRSEEGEPTRREGGGRREKKGGEGGVWGRGVLFAQLHTATC